MVRFEPRTQEVEQRGLRVPAYGCDLTRGGAGVRILETAGRVHAEQAAEARRLEPTTGFPLLCGLRTLDGLALVLKADATLNRRQEADHHRHVEIDGMNQLGTRQLVSRRRLFFTLRHSEHPNYDRG